jgi:hypothetical protein
MCEIIGCERPAVGTTQYPCYTIALCSAHHNQLRRYLIEDETAAPVYSKYITARDILRCAIARGDMRETYQCRTEEMILAADILALSEQWVGQAQLQLCRSKEVAGMLETRLAANGQRAEQRAPFRAENAPDKE